MPDGPSKIPVHLDRSALERVLARAAELQSTTGEQSEEFSEEQLLELGKEVGLSPQNLRQALAEERTRSVVVPEDESGIATQLFGPARVAATRTVPGTQRAVLGAIDRWMQDDELLMVKRQFGERIVWEPRQDVFVSMKRMLRHGGRDYALTRATEISATVVPISEDRMHVSLDADLTPYRKRLGVQGGVATTVVTTAVAVPVLVVAAPVLLAIVPALAAGSLAYLAARSANRRTTARAQLALEQLLDRLERGEPTQPPSLLGAIAAVAQTLPRRR